MLVALLAISGCGDSNNDFVFTGNNNNPNQTPGTLTFQFAKAQAATVPQSTTDIRFQYLDSESDVIDTDVVDYATSITVTPPTGTVAVRITALDGNGFPMVQIQGAVPTPPNGTNLTVDLTNFTLTDITFTGLTVTPDPTGVVAGVNTGNTQQLTVAANFSNGENVVFNNALLGQADFDDNNSAFYTVNATGLVTAVVAGQSTLTVSFTDSEGQTRSDTIDVNVTGGVLPQFVVTPDALNIPIGGTSAAVAATLDGDAVANNLISFSIVGNTEGFTANADGTVTVDGTVTDGTMATLQASYTVGQTVYTDTVAIVAQTAEVVSRQFSIPAGDTSLPYGITIPLQVSETFDNGQTVVVADPVAAGYTFAVDNDGADASVTNAGLLSTGGSTGDAEVQLFFGGAMEPVDTFVLDVDNSVVVSEITVSPDFFQLTPGESADFTVTASFTGGLQDIDVTNSAGLDYGAFAAGESTFETGTVTGGTTITYDPGTTYTIQLGTATDDIEVETALGFISSFDVTIGELESGNIPLLLDGVVETRANTADGRSLHFEPAQYTVTSVDADDTFDISGNILIPGSNAVVGGTDSVQVELSDTNYWYADGVFVTGEIEATYVSTGGSSSATAAFRHRPDVNVLFLARNSLNNSYTAANQVPRSLDLKFSNGQVDGFRVAASNTVSNASFIGANGVVADPWGYPAVIAQTTATNLGDQPATVMQIVDATATLVKAASFAPVRIYNRNVVLSSTSLGQAFVLPFQSIPVGDTDEFLYQVVARDSAGSSGTTFDMTGEFRYPSTDDTLARGTVQPSESDASLLRLLVTGLSTNGNSSVNVDFAAVNAVGTTAPGATLDITVTDN